MGKTFLMGDLHGAYAAMVQCLERAGFDYEHDTLIQFGDVADGYPQVYECVEELLKITHLIPLKGNHDEWLREFIQTDFHPLYWNHGGKGTLISYLGRAGKKDRFTYKGKGYKTALISSDIPPSHKTFFNQQRLYHIDEQRRFFVHAGFNRLLPLDKQRPEDFYWDRTLWSEALHFHTYQRSGQDWAEFEMIPDFSQIYIGHTPTTKWGTDKPLRALNILNLDTGAGHAGRLTIMDIATKQYWQSDPLPALYPEFFENSQV